MAEEIDDFAIEKTDAGASATIPMEAGQIKKGGYVFAADLMGPLPPISAVVTAVYRKLVLMPRRACQ